MLTRSLPTFSDHFRRAFEPLLVLRNIIQTFFKTSQDHCTFQKSSEDHPTINEDNPKIVEKFPVLMDVFQLFSEIFEDIWEIKETAACVRKQLLYGES